MESAAPSDVTASAATPSDVAAPAKTTQAVFYWNSTRDDKEKNCKSCNVVFTSGKFMFIQTVHGFQKLSSDYCLDCLKNKSEIRTAAHVTEWTKADFVFLDSFALH
jgi:hypothetical protein